MATGYQLRRTGEVHASLVFVCFAVASLLPTLLLLVNVKTPDPMAVALVHAEQPPVGIEYIIGIYDHPKTAAYCVAGAVLGAFLSLTVFPGKAETNAGIIRQLAAKFGSSMAVAMAFGPSVMDYFGVTRLNTMLAISAMVSLCGVSALHQIGPMIVSRVVGKAKAELNLPDEPKK